MIIIWQCGTWCWDADWTHYTTKGDPWKRMIVPSWMSDSEIDEAVLALLCGDDHELTELKF